MILPSSVKIFISNVLKQTEKTQADMATILGVTQSAISNKIYRETFKVSDLLEFCDTVGYDVIIVKRKEVR